MLQRLQALRGDKPPESQSTTPPPVPPPPRSVASPSNAVDPPSNRPVLPRPRLAKVLPLVTNEKDSGDDNDDDENEALKAMAMDAQIIDNLRQQTLLHRQSEKSMTRQVSGAHPFFSFYFPIYFMSMPQSLVLVILLT